jgi:uncharacterized protein YeaO (DUF488 family)
MNVATRSFFTQPIGVPVSIAHSQPETWFGEKLQHAKPDWWALSKYRKDGDWDDYSATYKRLLNERQQVIEKAVSDLVDGYGEATFCCWCKDEATCHRSLFADWLESAGWTVDRG